MLRGRLYSVKVYLTDLRILAVYSIDATFPSPFVLKGMFDFMQQFFTGSVNFREEVIADEHLHESFPL
ncbi:hypothetical protein CSA56_01140 [candidate division KSB3 bacterium]|uniref:Uncharacterized protein n=1 Tax=candidate division KSB3 bacterium TaxID=2044937 RepID=A0A2G6KMX9_9BACT|nr:MAG: hypothetical protein CSA56_01140 [candidate division KSB3 bacterium]